MIKKTRVTKETQIELSLELYGSGKAQISSGIGFFDHMLESFAKHSLIDLNLSVKGDLHVDFHHTVEDSAIVIGQALKEAIYPVGGIERFGDSMVVMDEACACCALDLSNRAFLVYEGIGVGKVGEFDLELVEEFFRAIAFNSAITLHIRQIYGKNSHHLVEASFKAFAVGLRRALNKNPRIAIPSTKGIL